MLNYNYTARNTKTGSLIKAMVQAEDEHAAAALIMKEGLTPLEIKLATDKGLLGSIKKGKVRTKDRVLFARQLSTLINAGLPLVQALRSVNDQTTSKPLKVVIGGVISDIEAGKSLSASLARYPRTFNNVFQSLVAAGEASGTLDESLERIANQQEKDSDIIHKIRGAMIYPLIVVLVMIAVVIFMLVKVLPQVKMLYTSFPGATLPIYTRVLLDLSSFVIHFWWLMLIIVLGLIGGLIYGTRTKRGIIIMDSIKINAPPFNTLFKKLYMARFARTASTLVAAGVPLLQVLQITADSVSNYHVSQSIKKASEKVKSGKSLGDSLTGDPYFLPLVPNMLKIGEQSGSMEQMLAKSAEYYEKEVDNAVKNISTIIEPVMMVLLGIVALVIVAAVLLPIYSLAGSGAISQGGV